VDLKKGGIARGIGEPITKKQGFKNNQPTVIREVRAKKKREEMKPKLVNGQTWGKEPGEAKRRPTGLLPTPKNCWKKKRIRRHEKEGGEVRVQAERVTEAEIRKKNRSQG